MRLGFITGLSAEARLLRDLPVLRGIGGGTPGGAARCTEAIAASVEGFISFGLAGGLDPALSSGTIIISNRIVAGSVHYDCDRRLVALLGGATCERLFGGATIARTAEEKASLFISTRASAIDLESAAVAEVAQRHGLPFAVLRAVADPASKSLPEAALLALDPEGRIQPVHIARSLARRPSQIPQLMALAIDAAAARRALKERLSILIDSLSH